MDLRILRMDFILRMDRFFMERIVRLRADAAHGGAAPPTVGVGAYSEGVNDDLNKAVWSMLALDPGRTLAEIVDELNNGVHGDRRGAQAKLVLATKA